MTTNLKTHYLALRPLVLLLLAIFLSAASAAPGHAQDLQETAAKSERIAEGMKSRLTELSQTDFTTKAPKDLVDLRTRCVGEAGNLVSEGRALVYVADVAA